MSMRIAVINGPNLNLLGTREPGVYGATTLAQLVRLLTAWGRPVGAEVSHFQSNSEGAIVDRLHSLRGEADGVVVNPGALTHYSYALSDALRALDVPTVEVHISNVMEREAWRRRSVVSPACVRTIFGRGVEGYLWAIRHLHYRRLGDPRVIVTGGGEEGDLRLPEGRGPHPVVVILHGGGWMGQWRRDQTDHVAVDLASRGYATYNFEYLPPHQGGRFPGPLETVDRALETLRSINDLDCERVALVGHSAGGTLALGAALRWRRSGFVASLAASLAGVTTFRPESDLDRAYLQGQDMAGASPRNLVPLGVRTLLVHARDDRIVDPEHSLGFSRDAAAAGDRVEAALLEGGGHMGFLDRGNRAWIQARERIISAFPP